MDSYQEGQWEELVLQLGVIGVAEALEEKLWEKMVKGRGGLHRQCSESWNKARLKLMDAIQFMYQAQDETH